MKSLVGLSAERPCPVLPARLVANARIVPKRADILPRLPKGGTFVEVGVALGDYSAAIMKIVKPSMFIAMDIFTIHKNKMIWGKPTAQALAGKTHEAFYRDRFKEPIDAGRMRVMAGDSAGSLAQLEDGSIDVAYVDADHTYDFVKGELALLNSKVAKTGWIVLNDYTMGNVVSSGFKRFGVIQAVHEFMLTEHWEMMFLALHPLMYCDVAIRRVA
jgi:hypothetical protein